MPTFLHTRLPLHGLVALLRLQGYEVGTAVMLDMQRIVANINSENIEDPRELKFAIAPLICRNKEEQEKFYTLFDQYLNSVSEQELTLVAAPVDPVKSKFKWWKVAAIIAGLIIIGYVVYIGKFKTPARISFGIVEVNERKTNLQGDTVRLQVDYADSSNAADYHSNWELTGPNNFKQTFQEQSTIAPVLDSPGAYTAIATTFNQKGEVLQADTANIEVLCEYPPQVAINDAGASNTAARFSAQISNAASNTSAYQHQWYLNDEPVAGDSVLRAGYLQTGEPNTIRVVVTWPGVNLHCSTDSLTSELEISPPLDLAVTADNKAPLVLNKKLNWPNILMSLSGLLLLPLLAGGVVWWRTRKPKAREVVPETLVETPPPPKEYKGPFTISFNSQQNRIVPEAGISQLAEVLRKRHTSDVFSLSIKKTIYSTIARGGFPVLEYVPRTSPTDFLVLLDTEFAAGHLSKLFAYVTERLKKEQVHISVYTFSREPLLLSNERLNHILLPIDKVARLYPETMLLLFTQADGFFRSYDLVLKQWATTKFKSWNTKLIITPIAKKDWGAKELALYEAGFTVVPADINAHNIIGDEINQMIDRQVLRKQIVPDSYSTRQFNFSRWRQVVAYLKSAVADNASKLNHAVDEQLLQQWLCALAVYPHLNWDVTIGIGKAFEDRFAKPGQLVNYTNLLILSRIQWMNDEQLMDSLELEMLNQLEPGKEALARKVIVDMMQEIKPSLPEDSAVQNEVDYIETANRFLLNAHAPNDNQLTAAELEQFKAYLENDQVDWTLQTYLQKGQNTLLHSSSSGTGSVPLQQYLQSRPHLSAQNADADAPPKPSLLHRLGRYAPVAAMLTTALFFFTVLQSMQVFQFVELNTLANLSFIAQKDSSNNNLRINALSLIVNDEVHEAVLRDSNRFEIEGLPLQSQKQSATIEASVDGFTYNSNVVLASSRYAIAVKPSTSTGALQNIDGIWNDTAGLYYLNIRQNKQALNMSSYSLADVKTGEGTGTITGSEVNFSLNVINFGNIAAKLTVVDENTLRGTSTVTNDGKMLQEPMTLTRNNARLPEKLNEIWTVQNAYEMLAFNLQQKLVYYYSSKRVPFTTLKLVEATMVEPATYRLILQYANNTYEAVFVRNITANSLEWGICNVKPVNSLQQAQAVLPNACSNFVNGQLLYANRSSRNLVNSPTIRIELPVDKLNLYTSEKEKLAIAKRRFAALDETAKNKVSVSFNLNTFGRTSRQLLVRQAELTASSIVSGFNAKYKVTRFAGTAFQRDYVEFNFANAVTEPLDCNRVFRSIEEALTVGPAQVCKLDLSGEKLSNIPKEVSLFVRLQQLNLKGTEIIDKEIANYKKRYPRIQILSDYDDDEVGPNAQLNDVLKAARGELQNVNVSKQQAVVRNNAAKYQAAAGLAAGEQWNTAFVYWCYNFYYGGNPLPKTGNGLEMWNKLPSRYKLSADEALKDPAAIKPGNVFFTGAGKDNARVGIIISHKAGQLQTIEADTYIEASRLSRSDKLVQRTRNIKEINIGFTNFTAPEKASAF